MKKIAIAVLLVMLLSSCIAFDSIMKFNDNGSGHLVFKYRVSQMFKSLGESKDGEGEDTENQAPFPVSKEKVEESLKDIEGIHVNSVKEWEDEQDVYVEVDLDFDNVESLQKADMFEGMPITLTTEGGKTTFTQLISEGDKPADPESIEMFKTYFTGYELFFKITAPRKVLSNNMGDLSDDSMTVTYTLPMLDLMQIKEKTELVITW